MYKVLENNRDAYGYQTVKIDPKQISKLTLDDLKQWTRVIVELLGDRDENYYEFFIPIDETHTPYFKNKYKEHGIDTRTMISSRQLVQTIQDKVKYLYKRQKELGDDTVYEVQVLLFRWNPMAKETTGVIRDLKGYNTRRKSSRKTTCKQFVCPEKMF